MKRNAKQRPLPGQPDRAKPSREVPPRKDAARDAKAKDPRKGLDHELVGTGNQELPDGAPD